MEIALAALLYSRDPQSVSVAKRAFDLYGIHATICRTAPTALEVLKHKRFDLLALDFDLQGLGSLLDLHRADGVNAHRIILGFCEVTGALSEPLRKRVRHWLQKPFTVDCMARALKATYGLMVTQKRTSFRCAVRIDATASYRESCGKRLLQDARVLDISQTGLCLKAEITVPKGALAFVDLQLPGTTDRLHVEGQVVWSDEKGRAGIEFRSLCPHDLRTLRDWLNARCPWIPELSPRVSVSPTAVLVQSEKLGEARHAIRH